MSKFKVGDKVRIKPECRKGVGYPDDLPPGEGEITELRQDGRFTVFQVEFYSGLTDDLYDDEMELVEQKPDIETFVKSITDTMKEHFGGAEDPISPSYYQFPNGVQVRDISRYLTSFGGQALQYVARSTRLDGNNKGDRIENLRKAIEFIQWEIERIEEEQA